MEAPDWPRWRETRTAMDLDWRPHAVASTVCFMDCTGDGNGAENGTASEESPHA